ncbi:MAG: response regulator [Bryobacterales bacterium]|nr:response regulator [Bryobacterales bacterium]
MPHAAAPEPAVEPETPRLHLAYRAAAPRAAEPRVLVQPVEPPGNLYASLARKRISAIGFAPQEAVAIERCLTAQFSIVDAIGLAHAAADGSNLGHMDLLILRSGDDAAASDAAFIKTLVHQGFPVLVTGPRRVLSRLVSLHKEGAIDFLNEPWDTEEVVWRSAGLMERSSLRRRRGAAEKMRILVADDDAASRTLLSATLDRCGMECLEADHGGAAIDTLRRERPHAAILEVVMPGLDGFQVLAEVRRTPELAAMPVAMLSLRQSEPDVLRGFGLGADDYITKPFSPMEVAARVKRLVARAS